MRHKAIQTAVLAQWGAKMDGLAAEKALPFENKYRRSCSAMCNPRRSTPFCIENVVHEFINTELHVKVGDPTSTGWTRSKQEQLQLAVTRAFQGMKELSFNVRHEKAKFILSSNARCLFGRLARAMTKNVLYIRAIRIWT